MAEPSLTELLRASTASRSNGGMNGGPLIEAGLRTSPGAVPGPQIGSEPLGAQTGAPPRTQMLRVQVAPASQSEPTIIADAAPASRVVVLTAPFVNFTIFVGDANVQVNGGFALPVGLQYEFVLPGLQALYAITDAPVHLPLNVQIAAILVGDRQRRYG